MAELFPPPRRVAAVGLVISMVAVGAAPAQEPADASRRAFEVASVKPMLSPAELGFQAGRAAALGEPAPMPVLSFGIRTFPGGRLTAGATLRGLIAWAYEIEEYEIDGGPGWVGEDYFAIDARADGDATRPEFNEMVQGLLRERFGLRTHGATRPGTVHHLALARPGTLGPALAPASPDCVAQIEARRAGTATASPPAPAARRSGPPDMSPQCGMTRGMGGASGARTLSVGGQPLSVLVDQLKSELGATVVDRTGLEGLFDFVVEYQTERQVSGLAGRGGLDPNSTESPKPPLRIAIERQLGLRLESVEGDVPILVVDAAERPTPN